MSSTIFSVNNRETQAKGIYSRCGTFSKQDQPNLIKGAFGNSQEIENCTNFPKKFIVVFYSSNLWRIFWLSGSAKWLGVRFRGSKRNFTIGQSLRIWGNFSKICIKNNKSLEKILRKFEKKCKFFRKFFNFRAGPWEK